MSTAFSDTAGETCIHGFWHEPVQANSCAMALTHGAGANCQSKLLIATAQALAAAGFAVLRFDLPFRVERRFGPPHPGSAAKDRDGLRRAAELMREKKYDRVFLGGHSYGGRQATMLAAEDSGVADGLFLLSYPLHPPKKPEQLRTGHFPELRTPAFFVHGTANPFATTAEMESALRLIPARQALFEVQGAGHDLLGRKAKTDVPGRVAEAFASFLSLH